MSTIFQEILEHAGNVREAFFFFEVLKLPHFHEKYEDTIDKFSVFWSFSASYLNLRLNFSAWKWLVLLVPSPQSQVSSPLSLGPRSIGPSVHRFLDPQSQGPLPPSLFGSYIPILSLQMVMSRLPIEGWRSYSSGL